MDHDRQDVSTPATRCAAGIMPVAVSLSNAPPTATPSSVMGPETSTSGPSNLKIHHGDPASRTKWQSRYEDSDRAVTDTNSI